MKSFYNVFRCLQATVSGLEPSQNRIIRIMASKSCYLYDTILYIIMLYFLFDCSYCMLLKGTDRHSIVAPYMSYFINDLCSISSESQEDHLFIILDSLQKVCQVCTLLCCYTFY